MKSKPFIDILRPGLLGIGMAAILCDLCHFELARYLFACPPPPSPLSPLSPPNSKFSRLIFRRRTHADVARSSIAINYPNTFKELEE